MLESKERAGENQSSISLYLDKIFWNRSNFCFFQNDFFCTLLSCVSQ